HPLPLHRNRKLLLRAALTLLASLLDGLCWAHRHAVSTYDLFSCHPSAPRPESIATALNCSSLISRWITAEILQHERLESRALALECALTLIQKATELKNLELAVALARGICHPAILRLGATFDALSPAVLSLFQSYTSRFFPNANLRSTPLSDSYPSGTLCPLQPLVAAIHRSYIQLGPLSSLQQDDAIDDVLGRHERILELAECYHFPTCISFLDVSVQAYQVSKLRGLLCNEATEIRDIIYSYGLQGNDDHLNAASLRLEPSSTGALQFMPKLPPRARSCFPYPPEVCALLLTIEPESIFRSTARTQAKLRRKSVKVALSNWKASTTHSEIEAVVSAWSGVRLGH
ncbi:MAG: RasGEF domain-containing protein, partial [archaeon]|nr:RasGEF domain-containing protein [archaeon]